MQKLNLAIFISGYGSNLQVFLENRHDFEEMTVISSNSKAYGVQRANQYQVPCHILDPKINWFQVDQVLKNSHVDCVFLAGFMKIVPVEFIQEWKGRIYNLHPSLLPRYKGLRAIERAYDDKEDVGVTIHHVTAEVDAGEIVLQDIAVTKDQLQKLSLDQVKEITHKKEHQLVLQWIESVRH